MNYVRNSAAAILPNEVEVRIVEEETSEVAAVAALTTRVAVVDVAAEDIEEVVVDLINFYCYQSLRTARNKYYIYLSSKIHTCHIFIFLKLKRNGKMK